MVEDGERVLEVEEEDKSLAQGKREHKVFRGNLALKDWGLVS